MIIVCTNCNKKFELSEDQIPDKGRLLQCGSCDNKWFYKKEPNFKNISDNNINNEVHNDEITIKKKEDISDVDKKIDKLEVKDVKPNNTVKNISFLSVILVFLISLIGIIILIDTFKSPLSKIIPNIEFLLNNIYETLKDIILFIKDLF